MKPATITLALVFMIFAVAPLNSCQKDNASITFQSNSGGDFTGDESSGAKTREWDNSSTKAEYNMDITSAKGGKATLILKDVDGKEVLNETLEAGVGDDSKSGVSAKGKAGTWEITIKLKNFDGDGSFSVDPA